MEPAPVVEEKKEEQQPPVEKKEKSAAKEEKPKRKKDTKSLELLLKELETHKTAEDKLAAACKKFAELATDNKKTHTALKQAEKKIILLQREKEQIECEKSKAVLLKNRMENLCRELQKQNKSIKEESLLKLREEEEKRKEISAKFQDTLAETSTLMSSANEKNDKLYKDNMDMEAKFRSLLEEMVNRERRFDEMKKMMHDELQITRTTLNEVSLEMTKEKESLLKDKSQLLLKLTEYQKRIQELQSVEANLRGQIAMYTEKYVEFHNALKKSNEVVGGFNEEMEKMSKKMVKLEKETAKWKSRWEKSQNSLLLMVAEKETRDTDIATLNKKCNKLQDLCKTFQKERATLIKQLKERDNLVPKETQIEEVSSIQIVGNAVENGQCQVGNIVNLPQEAVITPVCTHVEANDIADSNKQCQNATNIGNECNEVKDDNISLEGPPVVMTATYSPAEENPLDDTKKLESNFSSLSLEEEKKETHEEIKLNEVNASEGACSLET